MKKRWMGRKTATVVGMALSLGLLSAGYTATKTNTMEAVHAPPRSGGLAAVQNQDRTGSPVSSGLCMACHSGGSFGANFQIEVRDAGNNVVTSYTPGAQYTVEYTVSASSGSPSGYGMQAAILDASNSNAGNQTTVNTANTQVSIVGGRQLLEQQGASTTGFFSVDWTAPSAGTGTVTLYGNGIAINGNGGTSGDNGTSTVTLSLTEDIPTAIDFPGNPYCSNAADPTAVVTGEQGGSFSAPTGLDINGSSGQIDLTNSTPGTYTVTYTGLTQTATFDVTINEVFTTTDAATICANETFQFGTQTLTAADAGLNTEVFQTVNGCDSTVDLTLTVLPTPVTQLSQSICANETVQFNGQTLDASNAGLNSFTTSSVNGCDSTVELTLTVFPLDTTQISESICAGETFNFNGQLLDASDAGLNTATLTNSNGCDSVVELTLNVTQIDLNVTPMLFELVADQSNADYQWLDCENNFAIVPGETDQNLEVLNAGQWAVEITLNGCVDTSACEIPFYMGLNENTSSIIQVFPSPAENVLTVRNIQDLTEISAMKITSLSGQTLWSTTLVEEEIDVTQLPSGTYFLLVQHAQGEDIVKFVKR